MHLVKNEKTKRFNAIMEMKMQSGSILGMTGRNQSICNIAATPWSNVASKEFKSMKRIYEHFAGSFFAQDVEALQRNIHLWVIQRKKAEIFQDKAELMSISTNK
jgi:hypothetical protein